jgi:hypothetical protein
MPPPRGPAVEFPRKRRRRCSSPSCRSRRSAGPSAGTSLRPRPELCDEIPTAPFPARLGRAPFACRGSVRFSQ